MKSLFVVEMFTFVLASVLYTLNLIRAETQLALERYAQVIAVGKRNKAIEKAHDGKQIFPGRTLLWEGTQTSV